MNTNSTTEIDIEHLLRVVTEAAIEVLRRHADELDEVIQEMLEGRSRVDPFAPTTTRS